MRVPILHKSSVLFVSNDIILFLNTLLHFWKTSFAISINLQISVSHFSSSVNTIHRYLNRCTCLILLSPICNFLNRLFILLFSLEKVNSYLREGSLKGHEPNFLKSLRLHICNSIIIHFWNFRIFINVLC